MDELWYYEGMRKENLKCYFDTDFSYVEEFDTSDGAHHVWRVEPKDWNESILQAAIKVGLIDP